MRLICHIGWLLLLSLCVSGFAWAAEPSAPEPDARPYTFNSIQHPVIARQGMVSTQNRMAANVGRDILARGGNAVDAAVAVGFTMAVTHPQAGNLGGGGFMLLSLAKTADSPAKVIALDFREVAPKRASRDMYLREDGSVDNDRAQFSHLSVGVPGTVMGLLDALDTYGTMTRRQVMGPAVRLASQGFAVSYGLAQSFEDHRERLSKDPSSIDYFLAGGRGLEAGEPWTQPDLAQVLRRIVKDGRDGFYAGKTADLIVAEMQGGLSGQGTGLITHDDLKRYKTATREAVKGRYKDYDIYAMPPPSSGGVHVVQMLNILSGYDLQSDGHNSADYIHKLAEVMRRAFADRSKYLGDPDFYDVPVEALIDLAYADYLRQEIDISTEGFNRAGRSDAVAPATSLPYESPQTTHFSVLDKDGNAVAVTYTLNFSYGSGLSVDGAGFLLNNEMDDFSAKPGVPNAYGLIGGEANKIEPGKRPLSSMTPLIAKKDGVPVLVTGSIGGSNIINAVLQMALNIIEWDMNLAQAVHAPRIHHQWLPDSLRIESGLSPDTLRILEDRGFAFTRDSDGQILPEPFGQVNSVGMAGDYFVGSSDPRDARSAAIGLD